MACATAICATVLAPLRLCHYLMVTEGFKDGTETVVGEDVSKVLREIDVHLHDGPDVMSSCRKAGISDKTHYYCRKKFGVMGRSQLHGMSSLRKQNEHLKEDYHRAAA